MPQRATTGAALARQLRPVDPIIIDQGSATLRPRHRTAVGLRAGNARAHRDGRTDHREHHHRAAGDSPYLLTGFTKCSSCGGAIGSIPRTHGRGAERQRVDYYGCFTNHRRGTAICANKTQIRQQLLDRAVLAGITRLLDERVLEVAVEKELARLRSQHMAQLDRRTEITRELSLIEAREQRLVEAIKRGDAVEPLVAALKVEEERKTALTRELEAVGAVEKAASLDCDQIKRDLRARVADVQGLLGRHTPQARQMLRKLLTRIEMAPVVEDGRVGYRFVADGSFERLLSGAVLEALPPTGVAPTGFEPVFQP